jgi:rRNA-processing protein FCF1
MSNYFEEFDRHFDDHQFDLEQELNAALMALGIVKKKFEKLTQENARLREALEMIADDYCKSSACRSLEKQCDRCIARAVLEWKE